MSKILVTDTHLSDIAAAIRQKNGESTRYKPGEMAAAVGRIEGGYPEPTGTINITENGTHNVKDYASAQVNVQPNLQSKTATQNGTVTPDSGYDGLSSVLVDVSGGGQRFPNGYPMRLYNTQRESAMTITLDDTSVTMSWGSGSNIGANCWLGALIPAQLTKIRYHIEVGSKAYDNLRTLRFRPSLGVKASTTNASGAGPNTSDWLAINVYDTLNYSGDEELDVSGATGPFGLIICGHGCNVTFSNFEFIYSSGGE